MNEFDRQESSAAAEYNFAYLNEDAKQSVRRAILKAVAIPGHLISFAAREMPLPNGWGTGGIQITASLIGPDDVLKVIDQGTDSATNALSIKSFFENVAAIKTTMSTNDATIIQTRHRIPEAMLNSNQILILQVPFPDPFMRLIPRESERRRLHALKDYSLLYLKLYEDIARHGRVATAYAHPVRVNDSYIVSPSPIPKFDNAKLDSNPALLLFGAGTERQLYAIPPFTRVTSLAFDDYPFQPQFWPHPCALCGSRNTYLDEMASPLPSGGRFVCSDTDYCISQQPNLGSVSFDNSIECSQLSEADRREAAE